MTIGNNFVPIFQISLPLKAVFSSCENFERILCHGQWQWIFCVVKTIFFYSYFLKRLLELEGDQYLKRSYFCRWKKFSSVVFRHWFKWQQFIRPVKSCFFTNPLFRLVETDFQLITNHVFLFRVFLWKWTQILKLSVGQFLKENVIPTCWDQFLGLFQIWSGEKVAFSGYLKRSFHQILYYG